MEHTEENEGKVRKIPLSQTLGTKYAHLALYAVVDEADYEFVCGYHWSVMHVHHSFYAVTTGPGGKLVLMHRLLLDVAPSEEVDHKNHNGLDNRRENLRPATSQQNKFNRRQYARNVTSAYRGVFWDRARPKWCAQIKLNYRSRHLGRHDSEEDAALAYDEAARELHGEFASLNFPIGVEDEEF